MIIIISRKENIMEEIVKKYIDLRDVYNKCMDKKEKGVLTDEDS